MKINVKKSEVLLSMTQGIYITVRMRQWFSSHRHSLEHLFLKYQFINYMEKFLWRLNPKNRRNSYNITWIVEYIKM